MQFLLSEYITFSLLFFPSLNQSPYAIIMNMKTERNLLPVGVLERNLPTVPGSLVTLVSMLEPGRLQSGLLSLRTCSESDVILLTRLRARDSLVSSSGVHIMLGLRSTTGTLEKYSIGMLIFEQHFVQTVRLQRLQRWPQGPKIPKRVLRHRKQTFLASTSCLTCGNLENLQNCEFWYVTFI